MNLPERIILLVSVLFTGISCSRNERLEAVLRLAGSNRPELEKVLDRYAADEADSLKYRAAVFLIENMPGHIGYDRTQMDSLTSLMMPVFRSSTPIPEKKEAVERICRQWDEDHGKLTIRQDIEVITADYLIDHIDLAFETWRSDPWCRHLNFDEFCEFILPYRCFELQPLDDWRRDNRSVFRRGLDHKLKYAVRLEKYSLQACREVYSEMRRQFGMTESNFPFSRDYSGYPLLSARMLIENRVYRSCFETALMTMINMRSTGIPVALDFTPQWAERSIGHTWNALLTNEKKIIAFGSFTDEEPGILHKACENMVKVFRYTYTMNHKLLELNLKEKEVPGTFRNLFIRDVTEQYMQTTDLTVPVKFNADIETHYGYLAAFDNSEWVPLDFGKRDGSKIRFGNIGRTAALLPVVIDASGFVQPVNYPFSITRDDEIRYFIPDTVNRTTLTLKRKYPAAYHSAEGGRRLMQGVMQAANEPDFSDAVSFRAFETWQPAVTIRADTLPPYRYWRYIAPPETPIAIAEMMFIDPVDTALKITGKIIGTEGCSGYNVKEHLTDGDLLTYYESPNWGKNDWIGMDFGAPVSLSKVICYAVSDANSIEFGDTFELFYHNGKEWRSLGKKTAYDAVLHYGDAPSGNALFVLKNLTKGVETRIFTYENDEQVWW